MGRYIHFLIFAGKWNQKLQILLQYEIESMQLKRNKIDSGKETGESQNYDTLFGYGLATDNFIQTSKNCSKFLGRYPCNFIADAPDRQSPDLADLDP